MKQMDMSRKVKLLLESLNVCQKCILRFLGVRDYVSYANESAISKALEQLTGGGGGVEEPAEGAEEAEERPPKKRLLPSACAACLGLLQDPCEKRVEQIREEILAGGHVFEDFVLHVSVPVVMDLRDMLFHMFLKEKLGEEYGLGEADVPGAKEAWKWAAGPLLGEATGAAFRPDSPFRISVRVSYPDTAEECLPLLRECPGAFPRKKKKNNKGGSLEDVYTRTAVTKALDALASRVRELFPVPPGSPGRGCRVERASCEHAPLLLGGRYCKFSRSLSQTPWLVDGERRISESSVSELVAGRVRRTVACSDIVFSASGREDVDVRMLGSGRPFVLEILNPRRISWTAEEIEAIEKEINDSTDLIAVKSLRVISKEEASLLKEGEERRRKSYSALCVVDRALGPEDALRLRGVRDLVLQQRTPLRVLHRRTLSTRERTLHAVEADLLGPRTLRLRLETQAGTYVKEFVHGDLGRTSPDLGSLLGGGARADILELDVESIHLDWPPARIAES